MDKLHKYIHELIQASKKGKLVFFVGAGLSSLSAYPQWRELVNEFHIELYGKTKVGNYSSDEYLRIPQIFYDVKGEDEYDRILEEVFSVDKSTNPIHDMILAMNPVHIITTNYDDLIDKACWQRGRYFSIISAEEDVAKATSSRYLLKVHGDFRRGYKGRHIVLKESDYINYEQKYALISNLMKTIMATHVIVFVGYGLGDYNINLLLNWVKQLQKDGYNKPFFIRTDHKPIEENDAVYYENKGLRIIDSASLKDVSEKEYITRYSNVLDLLIESKDNNLLSEDEDVVKHLYQKLCPLFALQCVRKTDFKHVFEYDYHFEVHGAVVRNKNKGFGYLERFFELKEKGIDNLSEDSKQKFIAISEFLERNGILCMMKDESNRTISTSFEIESWAYHSNYDEMERFVQVQFSNLENEYKKAFFLACLGRWEDAYNLYSDLLLKSMDESNWWIHYLSQINRYWLYQSIIQSVKHFGSVAALLAFGRHYKPFTDEFLKCIEREMKNFDINDVFNGMPYEFQEKYLILKFLSDNEFLYDDTVKLFELTNKVRSEISKGSYSLGGLTPDIDVQFRLNDNIRFLYENCLWLTSFQEFKQYMRNSLMLQFEKAEYEQTRDIDDFGVFMGARRTGFYIDYHDFVNVAKSFSIDDIKYVERSCKIERFKFCDLGNIEDYLKRIANEIIKHFSKGVISIVFYNQFIHEAKAAFYFARHIRLSKEGFTIILKALLFYFPERDLDIGKRYLWAERLTLGSGLPREVIPIIEEFLIGQADKHKDNKFSEQTSNGLFSRDFGNLIRHFKKDFVSSDLSKYALELSEDMKHQIDFMYRLLPILSSEAKSYLLGLKKIEDIGSLMDSVQIGAIENISEYQDLIIRFMDKRKSKILADKEKGIVVGYADNYFVTFGIWYFFGKLANPKMKDYLGVNDEYDLFVDPEAFDYKKLSPAWLKKYSDELLKKIVENETMRPHIIEVLKERMKTTNDKQYFEIFMKCFI